MCELFGFSSKIPVQINDYLKEFYSHSEEHPHGWGLACMDGKEVMIEKEPVKASASQYLKSRLTVPVQVKNAFAHIRYATIGNVDYKNSHPYTGKDRSGRRWTLIHNGTIFDYPRHNPYLHQQEGRTDSERILFFLVDQVNQRQSELGRSLRVEERLDLLDALVTDMAKGNKLNLLIYDFPHHPAFLLPPGWCIPLPASGQLC